MGGCEGRRGLRGFLGASFMLMWKLLRFFLLVGFKCRVGMIRLSFKLFFVGIWSGSWRR